MKLIQREKAAHWYKWNPEFQIAESCYEVPKAKGGGMRAPTLADARKMNLLPSVTGVLSVLAKPGLEAWKQEQAILAALTLPRQPDEPLEAFAARVLVDMDAQSEAARSKGSAIHDAIAALIKGFTFVPGENIEPDILALLGPIRAWCHANLIRVHNVEAIVACPHIGVAGRLDLYAQLISGPAIVDFKTQTVKNGKPTFYDEWGLQLAAYRRLADGPDSIASLLSVVIDSATGEVYTHLWEDDGVLWCVFNLLLGIWQWQKSYKPSPEAELRRNEPELQPQEQE